jgi:hypothetical protein
VSCAADGRHRLWVCCCACAVHFDVVGLVYVCWRNRGGGGCADKQRVEFVRVILIRSGQRTTRTLPGCAWKQSSQACHQFTPVVLGIFCVVNFHKEGGKLRV